MIRLLLAGLLCLYYIEASTSYEPQVAFLCNKPTMHMTADGWEKDTSTDCLKDPTAILQYCQQKYADLNVTNIVQGKPVTIDNWCSAKKKHCRKHGSHTVTPYRCLVGAFQTDPLLVPEHCAFDHLYDPHRCLAERDWADLATAACTQNGRVTQSHAMLMPCGVEKFVGVEYVCCPREDRPKKLVVFKPNKPKQETKKKIPEVDDAYHLYLLGKMAGAAENEHEQFLNAMDAWKTEHKQKITEVMRQWRKELQGVQSLRSRDAKMGEEKALEIGKRYQKLYQNLEEEAGLEKRQLDQIHQERIQRKLTERKRNAMAQFLQALRRRLPDAKKIGRLLESYIRVEEKDKMHSLNHFLHLSHVHPDQALQLHDRIKSHIGLIDKRINQSIEMLSTLPRDEAARVRRQIMAFLMAYKAMDERGEKRILDAPIPTKKAEPSQPVETTTKKTLPIVKIQPAIIDTGAAVEKQTLKEKPKREKAEEHPKPKKKELKPKKLDTKPEPQMSKGLIEDESEGVEPEIMERIEFSTLVIIAVCGCAILIATLFGLFCMRRRIRRSRRDMYQRMGTGMSPEEYHVYRMQQHGYVNPTWEYMAKKEVVT